MVAAGVADEMLVQVSYAIGVAKPMNIFVNTFGRAKVNMTDERNSLRRSGISSICVRKAIARGAFECVTDLFRDRFLWPYGTQTPDGDKHSLPVICKKPVTCIDYSHGRNWIMQIRSRTCLVYKNKRKKVSYLNGEVC